MTDHDNYGTKLAFLIGASIFELEIRGGGFKQYL